MFFYAVQSYHFEIVCNDMRQAEHLRDMKLSLEEKIREKKQREETEKGKTLGN